ncbi:uncharacterized protein B0I36DRAFT_362027 [Microdochium trichocladiopsis]|uniref:Uncharacterized protein n=1 Tax=Microdochium trichocladiopsis TaxID=1682393 RepID=A0A9P8Y9B0_9PEZI|nr:uncharacterized protein B0I36DRAFT_362027 [Microdochium trichocladiopsis]KAH7033348.1 hypothetical protein B0I36DRAFT_362027 [Microdochium trichocladiopsis]
MGFVVSVSPLDPSKTPYIITIALLSLVLGSSRETPEYTGSPSDCRLVIREIRSQPKDRIFSLYSGLCVVFTHGACQAKLCAVEYLPRPVNQSARWMADVLEVPLLGECIEHSREGVAGDSDVINGDSGSYRLWIGSVS